MNKKKMLTSLALAGILTAGVMGANVNAATVNKNGVYNKLVSGTQKVVPYIVESSDDSITIADLAADFDAGIDSVGGITGYDSSAKIKTGDKFTSGNVTYTALVYGDVNKDGDIDSFDASAILQYAVGNKSLDNLAVKAGDVVRDDDTDSFDASKILKFSVGNESTLTTMPEKEDTEVVDKNFTLTVSDDNIVSNVDTKTAVKVKISVSNLLDKDKTGSWKLFDAKGTDITSATTTANVTLPANTSEKDFTIDLTTYDGTNNADGLLKVGVTLSNQTYTLKLVDTDGVIAKVAFKYDTTLTADAEVTSVDRLSTGEAKVVLESKTGKVTENGKEVDLQNITKVYYTVVDEGATTDKISFTDANNDGIIDAVKAKTLFVVSAENGIATLNITGLDEKYNGSDCQVNYIYEDAEGNRSEEKAVVIPSDKVKKLAGPISVELKDASDEENLIYNVTYNTEDDATAGTKCEVSLYRDGKYITKKIIEDGTRNKKVVILDLQSIENKLNEAGNYTVTVKAVADGSRNSDAKSSVTPFVVTALETVKPTLELKDINNVSTPVLTFKGKEDVTYSYQLYEYKYADNEWKFVKNGTAVDIPADSDNDYEVSLAGSINNRIIYKVALTSVDNSGKLTIIDSKIGESNEFFTLNNIAAANVELADTTGSLYFAPITVGEDEASYTVEAKVQDKNDATVYTSTNVGYTVEKDAYGKAVKYYKHTDAAGAITFNNTQTGADDDGLAYTKIKLTGLSENTKYVFRLKADIKNANGLSTWSDAKSTLTSIADINNFTVATTEAGLKNVKGTIGKLNNTTYYVNGNALAAAENYDGTIYSIVTDAIDQVKDTKGAKVKITFDKDKKASIIVDLSNVEENNSFTFDGTKYEDVKIIPASKWGSSITSQNDAPITIGASTYAANVEATDILLLEGSKIITLSDNAKITLPANVEVEINGIKVKSKVAVEIEVPTNKIATFNIERSSVSNDLTFKYNGTTAKNVKVEFTGSKANDNESNPGSLVIETNGNVDVASTNGEFVSANVTLTATDGTVTTLNVNAANARVNTGATSTTLKASAKDANGNKVAKVTGVYSELIENDENDEDVYDEFTVLTKLVTTKNINTLYAKTYILDDADETTPTFSESDGWDAKEVEVINKFIKKIVASEQYSKYTKIELALTAVGTTKISVGIDVTLTNSTDSDMSIDVTNIK